MARLVVAYITSALHSIQSYVAYVSNHARLTANQQVDAHFTTCSDNGCVFFAFRKGAAICVGLDLNISGSIAKKNALH